ncbi:MAG: alpha/beta hydrolase [Candidatus Nomurabacteria bacterium]|jgi:pimeloyl-ACP methyl ester carboxylesterase|nr:alpha/beta hydrolase [Candidatus Nomurabacteria bacterium]
MFDYVIHRILGVSLKMRVRYDRKVGRGDAKLTVVFLHGIASSYAVWRHVIKEIVGAKNLDGVRFVALDLVGFGKSKKPEWFGYDYRHYEKAIKSTLRQLKVRMPVILVGHSMGSLIATDYASENPDQVQSLVLVSPPFLRPGDLRRIPDKFYMRAYADLSKYAGNVAVGTIASFISKVSSFDKKTLDTIAFRKSMKEIILNLDNWEKIVKLKKPVWVVHGRLDPLVAGVNLRVLAKQNSSIMLTECMGGHDVSGLKCKKVAKIILDAIKSAP